MAEVITRTLVNSDEDVVIRPKMVVPVATVLAHGCVAAVTSEEILKCQIMTHDSLEQNYGFAPIVEAGAEPAVSCPVFRLLNGLTKAVLEEIRINHDGICLQYCDETGRQLKLHRPVSNTSLTEYRQQMSIFHGRRLVRTYVYIDYGFEAGRRELYAFDRHSHDDCLRWKRVYETMAGAKQVRSYYKLTIEEYIY